MFISFFSLLVDPFCSLVTLPRPKVPSIEDFLRFASQVFRRRVGQLAEHVRAEFVQARANALALMPFRNSLGRPLESFPRATTKRHALPNQRSANPGWDAALRRPRRVQRRNSVRCPWLAGPAEGQTFRA